MSNRKLASLFQDLSEMEEIEGNRWESLAYGKVAYSISTLVEDVSEIRKKGSLRSIEGVGLAIEKKIIEYLDTGKIEKHEKMKEKYPIDFASLRKVQGLGPKRIAVLFKELGIINVDSLEKAIENREVRNIQGFGEKSEDSLRKSVEIYRRTGSERQFLGYIEDDLRKFFTRFKEDESVVVAEIAGSARRKRETVGDLDILAVCTDIQKCSEHFLAMEEVQDVVVRGNTKISVRLAYGINCDLRIIDRSSFGAALQYFTGSKEHNIMMRDLSISRGLKLNEYGLYRNGTIVAGADEEGVYSALGLEWIPPELRENMGEIDAAMNSSLPDLIKYSDVQGDLHSHTDESDGSSSIDEMIEKSISMGMRYLAITEHSQSLKVANGLDEKRFRKRNAEIDRINTYSENFRVLKGVELEIKKDGSLDLPEELLKEMDVVILALHQWVGDNIKENTDRILKAIGTGLGTTLAHPTGRMIGTREPYLLDFDKIFEACASSGVAIEVNGYPERSDLPYYLVKRAREYGLKFTLGSDSHHRNHLRFLGSAVSIARRGWLEKKDVLNCLSSEDFLKKIN